MAGTVFQTRGLRLESEANEPVGKVLLTSETDVFRGHLTLPKYEIVDCAAFCEVIFFCISPKNLLGDFFYSLNVSVQRPAQAGESSPARDPTAADRRCARRARIYLARFQTTSSVTPEGVRGLVNFSSSAVREVTIRLCSPPTFANVLPSSLRVMTFSLSLTEYVPK